MSLNKGELKDNELHRTLYWVCKEFGVLPTEQRFKDLTIQQVNWLVYWKNHFDDPASPEPPSQDIQDILNQSDNQDKTPTNPNVGTNIQKLQDAADVLGRGGDITDWEDITKEFLEGLDEFSNDD